MNSTTRNAIIGAVIVVLLVLLGYLVWQERQSSSTSNSPTSSATTSSSTSTGVTVNISTSTQATTTGGYTITPITASTAPTPPNYAAPLVFSDPTLTADEETQLQSQFAQAETTLALSPTDYGSWIDLGIVRMEAGDYTGAAADWTYVTEIYPSDPTAFADLGNLYATYLKEPSQGITYYKDAIKLDPTQEVSFYQNLAQIYISEDDTTDAKAVLEQGISAQVVGYQNLQTQLNSMQ